jgi:hypothetical protein
MRSMTDPEDIRFFDRTHQRTIAIYASKRRRVARPYFNEDDQVGYDILNYDVDASFDPQRVDRRERPDPPGREERARGDVEPEPGANAGDPLQWSANVSAI